MTIAFSGQAADTLLVPTVEDPVRYGADPVNDRVTPAEHLRLVTYLIKLLRSSEYDRAKRIEHMVAIETDLLGIVEPTGTDCERKEKRKKGEDVSVPDAIYPFGWITLQKLAAEVMKIVFPAEAPYAVAVSTEKQQMAQAMVKAFRAQGVRFSHRSNIQAAVFDTLALDCGAMEFYWAKQADGRTTQTALNENVVGHGEHAGMAIKSLDPYNITWDPTVDIADVATEGEFFAHFDRVSAFKIRRENNRRNFLHPKIVETLRKWVEPPTRGEQSQPTILAQNGSFCTHTSNSFYYEVEIAKTRAEVIRKWGTNRSGAQVNFTGLFSGEAGTVKNTTTVHKTVMYVRLRPAEWGLGPRMAKSEIPNSPYELWEFHLYGPGYLGYAGRVDTRMDRFPVALASMNYRRDFGRSFKIGEHAAQLGLYASTILNMNKRALRKGIEGGLTLFNPEVFNLNAIEDTAGGRVPADNMRWDDDIRRHVMQLAEIPDTKSTVQHAAALNELLGSLFPVNSQPAMMGLDRATTYQAQSVMATSITTLLYYAGPIDDQLLVPARLHMHRFNLLNNADLTYLDENKSQLMKLAASELENTEFELVQSQPLMGIDRLRIENILRDMLNILFQSGGQLPPAAAMLMKHYIQVAGITINLDEYMEAAAKEEQAFQARQEAENAKLANQGAPQ